MLLLGYEEGTDLPAKHAEFAKTLEGQGYTLLGQCKTDSGQVGSQDFLKAPAEYVQVFTRTDTMLNVLFTKSLKVLEMSSDKCSFTDAAATLCKTLDGSRCSFED